MKLNDSIHYEPSANAKTLSWSTRARPLSLGGFTYHGLTDAAHAGRDVGLLALGFALEAISFAVLGHKFNFTGSLIVGLWVFDIAGALLWHAGCADSRLREAKIKTAASQEDEEAIREQRPRRYGWLKVLGAVLIAGPCLFKCLLLLSNPLVFKVMGLGGPALLVAYIGIAVIHFGYTGYALAYLRALRAERKELSAMLKSGSTDEERKRHPNRIKAHRKHYFISQLELVEVDNVGGHSLKRDPSFIGVGHRYILTTGGRLFDHQVAEMVARQTNAEQRSKLGREGLIHQLEIEQGEPLAAAETVEEMDNASVPMTLPVTPAIVPSAVPATPTKMQPDSGHAQRSTPMPLNGLGQTGAALMMLGCILGLSSCSKPETKKVHLVLVSDHPLAAGEKATLPEHLLNLLAPERPLLEQFVVEPTAVRLDFPENSEAASLLPPPITNALFGAMQDMSQLNSPELEAADRRQRLTSAEAGVLGSPKSVSTVPPASRWLQWAQSNHDAGYKVVALRQKSRPIGVELDELAGFGKPTEAANPEEVHNFMEAVLVNEPEAKFAVLIDPPVTQSVKMTETAPPFISAPVDDEPTEVTSAEESPKSYAAEVTTEETTAEGATGPKETFGGVPIAPSPNVTVSGPFIFMPEKSGELPRVAYADGRVHPIQKTELAGVVPFDKTEARINPETERALINIDAKCKEEDITEVILHGSADPKGGKEMVETLSQRRCNTVKAWLLERGINTLESIPLGADRVPTTTSEKDYEQHRVVRVFFLRRAVESSPEP